MHWGRTCCSMAPLWPGMAPELFSKLGQNKSIPHRSPTSQALLIRGVSRSIIGIIFMVVSYFTWINGKSLMLCTMFILPGISLILHFGIFNIIAAFWRKLGIPTYVLFPAPLAGKSLGEFWGKRWILPFTEMIQRGVYKPLTTIIGRSNAAFMGFLFSGLLHECAISHPVQKGYGLPLLYFMIHGVLVLIERKTGLRSFLEKKPIFAHIWTLGWLVLPMPILFHPSFLNGVVWPLVNY